MDPQTLTEQSTERPRLVSIISHVTKKTELLSVKTNQTGLRTVSPISIRDGQGPELPSAAELLLPAMD